MNILEFSQVFFNLLLVVPPTHTHIYATHVCVRSCVCLFDRRRSHKDSALNSDIACRKGLDCVDQI